MVVDRVQEINSPENAVNLPTDRPESRRNGIVKSPAAERRNLVSPASARVKDEEEEGVPEGRHEWHTFSHPCGTCAKLITLQITYAANIPTRHAITKGR